MGKPKAPPKQASNESRAVLKMYRISDQKLNLLAQQIRGLKVDKAMAELEFSRKRAAVDVLKLLKSAVANADNNHNRHNNNKHNDNRNNHRTTSTQTSSTAT